MSFAAQARSVRDTTLPLPRRAAALRRCVTMYAPYGYTETLAHLTRRHPGSLEGAVDALASSRNAWLAELDSYAKRRREAKRRGNRSPSLADAGDHLRHRWPGGDDDRIVATSFLTKHGVVSPDQATRWEKAWAATPSGTPRTPPPTAQPRVDRLFLAILLALFLIGAILWGAAQERQVLRILAGSVVAALLLTWLIRSRRR